MRWILILTPPVYDTPVLSILQQSDNKIILLLKYNDSYSLIRMFPEGSQDTELSINLGSPYSIGVQPDGKILIAEFSIFHQIRRLLPNGENDPDFTCPKLYGTIYSTAVIEPDGKILVGRTSGQLIRLFPNGTQDVDFIPPKFSGDVRFIKLQPDAKKLVVLQDLKSDSKITRLIRLLSDGKHDNSFKISIFNHEVYYIQPQPDGRILVGGALVVTSLACCLTGRKILNLIRLN